MKKKEYKITVSKFFKHLHLVNRHRFKVFCLCFRAGEPLRGLLHDLSKYGPEEFFEGVKYYEGNYSPIRNCKIENGYSKAWIHHIGRNKHHYEYWYDYNADIPCPIMPYKYFVEMICDSLAAGMIYEGKKWDNEHQMHYWLRAREKAKIHPKMDKLLTKVYTDIAKKGIKPVLKKEYLRDLYKRYTR